MKSFTETLDQQGNSNSQEIISLKKNIYTKSYSKGTLLQHPGSANKFAFYVKKGLLLVTRSKNRNIITSVLAMQVLSNLARIVLER